MGLSAGVFKSVSRLRNEHSREFEIVDAETGEAAAADDRYSLPLNQVLAGQARLGNVAQLAYLRSAVKFVLGEQSIIDVNVLNAGSGD
jgi:hypothetical protein